MAHHLNPAIGPAINNNGGNALRRTHGRSRRYGWLARVVYSSYEAEYMLNANLYNKVRRRRPCNSIFSLGESGSSRRDLPILEFVRHHCYIAVVTSTPAAYYTDLPIPIVFSLHNRIVSYMFANCDREGDDANSFFELIQNK